MSPVRYENDGPVAIVTLDRPEARNAVDGPTARALLEAFQRFEREPEMRVAILTGAGGTFCAGADLKAIGSSRANPVREDGEGPMGPTHLLLGKPVLAAVEGHAVAGGLELALWCDLRIAGRDAIFGVYCRRWGVPLVDGGTVRLPRLIGHSHALDMILTGRGVAAEEAKQMGLVNRLVERGEALSAAVALGKELARFPELCLRNDRLSSYAQWGLDLESALRRESRFGLEVIDSGETREGAKRFSAGAGRHGSFSD